MAFALPAIPLRMTDANGNVLAGAKLYVFAAGTTTPVDAYTTSALSVAHASPIVADSGGLFDGVFLATGTYKLRYTTSAGSTLFEIDNYAVSVGGSDVTFPTAVKTANFTITADDQGKVFLCDASGAAGLNINAIANAEELGDGFPFFIVNTAATGTITVQGTGAQLVDGASSSNLSTQNGAYGFISIGAAGWQSVMRSGISASTTEVLTGTDTAKAVSADALAALWEKGSDIASAGTITIGDGGYFDVTGTTTITDIDLTTDVAGREFELQFDGALTLTHSSALVLPNGLDITTEAGDVLRFRSEGSDVVRCVSRNSSGGMRLIGTLTTTGSITSSLTSGTWTGFRTIVIEIDDLSSGTSNVEYRLRITNDSGTTWSTGSVEVLADAADSVGLGNSVRGFVEINNAQSTASFAIRGACSLTKSAAAAKLASSPAVLGWNVVGPINGVRFELSSGVIDAITARVYGIK